MNVYRRRGLLRRWTLALACATFWLTIVATWTTRTGLISSVHAFERNNTLVAILSTLLAVVAVVSVGLLAWRWRRFGAQGQPVALSARDVAHELTDVALAACAAALLAATVVVPLALGRTVGPSTYRLFAQPLGVAVVAAVALCPLLSLGRATGWTFGRAVRWPLLVAAVALPVLLFAGDWRSSLFGLLGLEVCCFAAAAVVTFIGELGLLTGLRRALTASRTRSAAYVAHFGVILVLAGLLGSNVYKVESGAYLPARVGATAQVAGYTLRFTGFSQGAGPQGSQRSSAHFVVTRGGRQVGLLAPRTDVYPQAGAAVRAVILGSLPRDLFVVAQDPFDSSSTHLRLQLDVFPLVRLVWLGVICLVAGAGVSLWPRRERAPVTVREPLDSHNTGLEPHDEALEGGA
jgi:cytochrome c-type biogenesis protein CcmF